MLNGFLLRAFIAQVAVVLCVCCCLDVTLVRLTSSPATKGPMERKHIACIGYNSDSYGIWFVRRKCATSHDLGPTLSISYVEESRRRA